MEFGDTHKLDSGKPRASRGAGVEGVYGKQLVERDICERAVGGLVVRVLIGGESGAARCVLPAVGFADEADEVIGRRPADELPRVCDFVVVAADW